LIRVAATSSPLLRATNDAGAVEVTGAVAIVLLRLTFDRSRPAGFGHFDGLPLARFDP
jgi:hypothetical protein